MRLTEEVSIPFKVQDWFYFEYAKPEDEHSRLYRTKSDSLVFLETLNPSEIDKNAEVFFDPDRDLADPKIESVTTASGSWSDDGNYWAYAVKKGGSDWETIKVRDAATNKDLADELSWVKFSGAMWTADSRGFFYTKYDEPEGETRDTAGTGTEKLSAPKLMYHRLGTKQAEDALIYENPEDPELSFEVETSYDDKYLLMYVAKGTDASNLVYYADLKKPENREFKGKMTFTPLVDEWIAAFNYI